MSLQVVVIKATNVPNAEKFGESDPYVSIEFQGIKKKTEVIKSNLNPVWNETFDIDLLGKAVTASDELQVKIMDWERVGRNRLLAQTKVPLRNLLRGGTQSESLNLSLTDSNGRPTQTKLEMKLLYKPPASASPAAAGASGGGDPTQETEGQALGDSLLEGDEGDEEEEVDTGPPQIDPATGQVIPKPKRRKKRGKFGRRKILENLSTKPTDFQIRVKVIEARQLQGANIQPVAKVTVSNQTKQTRVKKSTNSPSWNEAFFFNFKKSPLELMDELIEFKVFNSKKLRSDALIGSFKCDIGMVYIEPRHSFLHKWMLLSDPEDQMAGAKGYLKVCVCIIGPGDEAPSFKPVANEESDDIESNLLRPAGVQLQPATFTMKLYRAEDIPRMDSAFMQGVKKVFGIGEEQKELVDPYFVFSFAGKEVQSKIMYNNDHPDWNQILKIGIQFPSMCERLKFTIKDWDRINEDDTISSAVLSVPLISSSAQGQDGFLPTFGPSFVNFYGSTREYSDLPDEYDDLNLGKGEGVAYRGRALVELQTNLGELPEVALEDIQNDDLLRVQKFMRRRKYKLHAAFLNATMVNAIDAPVEFEVSIGNYGNKLDENTAPCASTTQPTNAVFDGCHYYFLPWSGTKPCVVVESSWEDISFRLEGLNLLLKVIDTLEANIEQVSIGIKAKLPTPELAQLLISLLDQLEQDCRKSLPEPKAGKHVSNELDRLTREYRQFEFDNIKENVIKLKQSATDVHEAMAEVENYLQILKNLAKEPQNSMPDVVIWMISGEKRLAYHRIPANEVLWSNNPDYIGRLCGRLQSLQLKFPGIKAEKEKISEVPALLRIKIWLGLANEDDAWHRMQTEGELAVFAETYENECNIPVVGWTKKGPLGRPKWSDSQGKCKLPRETFEPPPGWRWEGDWYVSPELSMLFDKDAGHKTYMEECYEMHSRLPATSWGPASRPWTDVKGDEMPPRDSVDLPPGWVWEDVWQIDLSRAVDEEGWEYCVEATMGGYGPVEKRYHLCRRRRWVRNRKLVEDDKQKKHKAKKIEEAAEGWEYAPLFNLKFHATERTMDLVRRRRWHRKMVCEKKGADCFFAMKFEDEDDKEDFNAAYAAPRMFLTFKKPYKYQLRTYIYQARDLLAGDETGLSDPYARISFLTQSSMTEKMMKSLCPTWDQTLIFEEIEIYGDPQSIAENPPEVVVEIFDFDKFGSNEFLGRTKAHPMVKLDPGDARMPVLQWYPITRGQEEGGELLAAFELFLVPDKNASMESLLAGSDLPFLPPKKGDLFLVPNGIRPVMQRTAIEVLCWGVRNMKKFQLAAVTSPSIEFECGGHIFESKVIKNTKKNPNFDENILFFDVMLPREELYMPPMNIRVRDHRQFGRKPTVGIHVLKSLEDYRCEAVRQEQEGDDDGVQGVGSSPDITQAQLEGLMNAAVNRYKDIQSSVARADSGQTSYQTGGLVNGSRSGEHVIEMPVEEKKAERKSGLQIGQSIKSFPQLELPALFGGKNDEPDPVVDEEIDWWSKYYASTGQTHKCRKYVEKGHDKIEIYETPLEDVEFTKGFTDFCSTFELQRGKDEEDEESSTVGEFKGGFKVYPLPPDPNEEMPSKQFVNLPSSAPEECIIRVYVVCCIELQPNDSSGLADPYVEIILGNKKISDRDNYKPNTIDPVFGQMFELTSMLPVQKDLTVRIKDYDLISSDDVIGETVIDLENRYVSKFRATCGLQKSYCIAGVNQWRDGAKPREILDNYCKQNHVSGPLYYGNNSVKVGKKIYNLADFEPNKPVDPNAGAAEERLALHVLHTLPLIKEHVETRPLFNPIQPGIEQGKVQMWVDIFPKSIGPPGPPFNIEPRRAKDYILRIIIWNTVDVVLDEESITGEQMSDIYVKGWVSGIDEKQKTDVHYRSLDGEGNFNWRFVFPFSYVPAEQVMEVRKKEHFWSLDETVQHLQPNVMIQVWDNDKFSMDDFLGTLCLNLNAMPKPAKKAGSCKLTMLPDITTGPEIKLVSLFEQKRLRGFWPVYNDETGERVLTGKVEMELELVTCEEAEERPAGQGQEEPNMNPKLDPPKRPETSFLWFASPWKTLRYIIWRNYKWYIIGFFLLILLLLLIFLFLYSFPGDISQKIVNG
ncbi:myoferlin-like isoform X3 [Ostrea edulis]|uniref:myoferlin-like isoform X3 n=1 Tax=Ostrea edulis TaxID=37623 RepID=UPI0024AFAEFE|nr:myoferlin-like isoform X3 [Ostrea edulis]